MPVVDGRYQVSQGQALEVPAAAEDAGGTGLAFLSDREAEGDEGGDGEGLSLSSPTGRRGPG